MSEIWPSPAKACPQIREHPAGVCPQMSGDVLGLGVSVFGCCPIRPVRHIRPVTPRQKEKRFPNRFHKKMTSASLSKRKGFRFSFAARNPPAPTEPAYDLLSTN